MNDDERRLRSLPARPLSDVLSELASLNEAELRGGRTRAPLVTMHLRSGRTVEGVVVHFARERNHESISVHTGARSRHEAARDVTYVPLSSVEALTVHEASSYASPPAITEPPPTRLAARRALEQHRKRAVDAVGRDFEWAAPIDGLDGEPLRALVALSADAADALAQVARDELGRAALADRVSRIGFENAASGQVVRDGDRIVFFAAFAAGPKGRLDDAALRNALDAVL